MKKRMTEMNSQFFKHIPFFILWFIPFLIIAFSKFIVFEGILLSFLNNLSFLGKIICCIAYFYLTLIFFFTLRCIKKR